MKKIDAHQHLWDHTDPTYDWLTPEMGAIYATFTPEDIEPQVAGAGVDATVLVQSADAYSDTESMLDVAERYPFVAGVVGWVPLLRPAEAAEALDRFAARPAFRGIRHLIHNEPDPDWLLQDVVADGLRLLSDRSLTFDVVAVLPRHLEHIPIIAERCPELRMVIDHLAKPPISEGAMEPWRSLMARAAEFPNVYAKISGLNTAAGDPENWSAADIQPYIEAAVELFGADRLMFGGDWPIAILAGDYQKVWVETNKALADLDQGEQDKILGGTAIEFYGLRV